MAPPSPLHPSEVHPTTCLPLRSVGPAPGQGGGAAAGAAGAGDGVGRGAAHCAEAKPRGELGGGAGCASGLAGWCVSVSDNVNQHALLHKQKESLYISVLGMLTSHTACQLCTARPAHSPPFPSAPPSRAAVAAALPLGAGRGVFPGLGAAGGHRAGLGPRAHALPVGHCSLLFFVCLVPWNTCIALPPACVLLPGSLRHAGSALACWQAWRGATALLRTWWMRARDVTPLTVHPTLHPLCALPLCICAGASPMATCTPTT